MSEIITSHKAYVCVGQIGAPYGVRGWNHVRSFTQPLENILQYSHWYLLQKDQWILHEVLAGRKHGASIVAQLKGNDGRDQAALFSQCKIALLRSQLPALAPNEFYWVDLEGLAVHTLEGKPLGFVASLYNSAGVDVMIVTQENKEQHIPFLMDDTVVKVDMQEKVILVDWDIPND